MLHALTSRPAPLRFAAQPAPQTTADVSPDSVIDKPTPLTEERASAFFPPDIPVTAPMQHRPRPKKGIAKLMENLKQVFDPKKRMKPLEKDLYSLILQLHSKLQAGEVDFCVDKPIRPGIFNASDGQTYVTQIKDIKIGGKSYEFIRLDGKQPYQTSGMNAYQIKVADEDISLLYCHIGKQATYENNTIDYSMWSADKAIRKQALQFFRTLWTDTQAAIQNSAELLTERKVREAGGIHL